MKLPGRLFTCILIVLLTLSTNELYIKASSIDELKNVWYETHYYPIYFGGAEWGKHSMEEMFEINNPPIDLLISMTSEELASLLFESPYLPQITTYFNESGQNDYSTFFMFLENHSDIFYELLRREDGITAILKQYQNNGVDTEWFEKETYNTSGDEQNRWYSEVFGSQFIHLYSPVFTKDEVSLANQIIEEKNRIYMSSANASSAYFDTSVIGFCEGNISGVIRSQYLSSEEISKKENEWSEVIAQSEIEIESSDDDPKDFPSSRKGYFLIIPCILALVLCSGIIVARKEKH